jgi:ankyrin repeat protein
VYARLSSEREFLTGLLIGLRWQTGDTALHLATNKGRADMVQAMLEHKLNVNVQNKV